MIGAPPTAAKIWKRIGVLISDPNGEMQRWQNLVRPTGCTHYLADFDRFTDSHRDVAEKGHRRAKIAAVADRDCLHPGDRASKGDNPRPGGAYLGPGRCMEIDPVVTSIASNGCVNLDNRSGDGRTQTDDDQDF
ncbi:hypothetical protein BH18ACT5_BH18ACT5_14720 [soil metagenome]